MADPIKTVKYIVEALRQKPREPGITRDRGDIPRRMAGPLFGQSGGLKDTQNDLNYVKYKRQQSAMGESPVTYEEWLQR